MLLSLASATFSFAWIVDMTHMSLRPLSEWPVKLLRTAGSVTGVQALLAGVLPWDFSLTDSGTVLSLHVLKFSIRVFSSLISTLSSLETTSAFFHPSAPPSLLLGPPCF